MPAYKRKLSRSNATAGSYKRRRLSVAQKANAALSMARQIKRGIEVKGFGVSRTGTVTNTEDVKHLTAIPQGDGNGARDGDHIMATRVRLRGVISGNNALSFQSKMRVVIVQNLRQQPDTDATMTSQFTSADLYGFNLANQGFKNLLVHYDQVHSVPIGGEVGATPTYKVGRKFVDIDLKLKYPVKVSFNEAAATDIDRNGFYIICVSDASSNSPSFSYEAFIDFTDA